MKVTVNQVNVKVRVDLFIMFYTVDYLSHLPTLAQIEQKCLYIRGNEIELEVLCQLDHL